MMSGMGMGMGDDERFEIPIPLTPALRRRTAVISTAAAVLFVAALLAALTVALFRPAGAIGLLLLGLAALQAVAALSVFVLHPLGRPLGIGVAILGVVLGLVSASSSGLNGLFTVLLNGFVIYALASNGPAFRRG